TQECVRHVGDQPGPTWLIAVSSSIRKSPVTLGGLSLVRLKCATATANLLFRAGGGPVTLLPGISLYCQCEAARHYQSHRPYQIEVKPRLAQQRQPKLLVNHKSDYCC